MKKYKDEDKTFFFRARGKELFDMDQVAQGLYHDRTASIIRKTLIPVKKNIPSTVQK
jgi:hypothetical protein